MSLSKSPFSNSSRQVRLHRKSTGEEEWAYTHNPYDDSRRSNDFNAHTFLNPCRHYAEGRCNRGSTCRFYHDTRHTVIVAPHGTPKQRSITSLTGLSLAAAPTGGGSRIVSPLTACLSSPNRWMSCMPSVVTPTSPVTATTANTPTVFADALPPRFSDSLMASCCSFRCAPMLTPSDVSSPFFYSTATSDGALMTTPKLNSGNNEYPAAIQSGGAAWSP